MISSNASEQQALPEPEGILEHSGPESAALTESEAIKRAQRGDTSAFERIYQLYGRRVYALCLRMARNPAEAEDLTQEAFLTVFRKIHTFRGTSAFYTWLHRIAVNLVLMRLRKQPRLQASPESTGEQGEDRARPSEELGGPDLLLAGSLDRLNLERAINRLKPCHKLVVVLHDIQGYKHREIAQILDWSIGNSKAQLHRAHRKLRESLRNTPSLRWVAPVRANQTASGTRMCLSESCE